MRRFSILFLLLFLALSCRREQAGESAPERQQAHFSVVVEDLQEQSRTKTVLTDDSIETKVTSITMAVYSADGKLVEKRYVTSGFNDIRYMLVPGETFLVYALANMGDMRDSFPSSISGDASLESIAYSIPSYTSGEDCINARGIPMAGKLVYSASGGAGQIALTRLLAKLQVHLSCQWPGTFRTVKIYNLNKTLKPFGVSAAASESDILDQQEIHILEADAQEGDLLFYIPENRQGTVPGIQSPREKSRDNDAVEGKDLKSYLEVEVTGKPGTGVNGTLTYRSYLGGNNSTDFNILRNNRYAWQVEYLPGNLQNNDWKHQNALSWKEFDYSFSAPSYIYWKEEDVATLSTYSRQYENGAFVQRKLDSNTGIPSISYSISSGTSVLGNAYGSGTYFYFTGLAPGTGTVQAICADPFHTEGVTLTRNVRVLDFGREIFLRTPIGDFYPGNTILIPYGTTWNDVKVGMRKTRPNGTTEIVCPIAIGTDNLDAGSVHFPSYGKELIDYGSYNSADAGKPFVFSHTFTEKPAAHSYLPNQFTIYAYYTDYGESWHQLSARMPVEIVSVDTEIITVASNKESAHWIDGSVSLTATSTAVHNGTSGAKTDISTSADYEWSVTGSVSGMNPRLTSSGGAQILTASKAGTVTVTVTRKSDSRIKGSKEITFSDKVTYRLNVTPKTRNVQVGDSFSTSDFSINQDKLINGVYHSTEPYPSVVFWDVKSGSESCLKKTGGSMHPVTITAKAKGTGYLKVNSYSSSMESGYTENEIQINVGVADSYSISLSPASVSMKVDESSAALGFSVKNNGATVSVSASNLSWHTRNSAVATVSGGVVTGKTAGTTKVYATYGGATSNEVDVTVLPADVTTYRYKVKTTVNPAGIKVGQTSTAGATRYKRTYVNGSPTTDWVADGDVTSGGFKDRDNTGKVSVAGSTLTALSTGSLSIRSLSQADEYEDAVLSITDADYAVSIQPSKGVDLVLGKQTPQTYTASATRNGTAYTGGTFEWSLSPAGKASLNSATGSSVTVTPLAAGNVTLTVNYKVGASVKASASVGFTVTDNPLQLAWSSAGAPVYVAQRGLLEVSGLDLATASVSYEILSGADKVRLTQSGKNTYVSLVAPGSYSIRATASNGQSGTFSGSVSAPALSANTASLYANPDGSWAHTGTDGLAGNTLAVVYKGGSVTLSTTANAIAVGSYLYQPLYEELLAPRYNLSAGTCLEVSGADVRAARLSSPAYPSAQGSTLGTVTVSAKAASAGVANVPVKVLSVNPFSAWNSPVSARGDVEDWGLLKGYYTQPAHYNESFAAPAIRVSEGQYGMKAFINGKEAESDLQSVFRGNVNGGSITWNLSQEVFSGFARHQAGDVVLKAYVRNSRSGEYLYHSFASFRLLVHGAVGGRMVMRSPVSNTTFQAMYMQAGFTGNVAGTPFAANGIYSVGSSIVRWEGIDRSLGTCPYYVANVQEMANFSSADDYILNIIPGEKTAPGTYTPAMGQVFVEADAEAFMMSTPPKLRWGTVQQPQLVKADGPVLYMKNSIEEPGRTIGEVEDCGYYILHLLGDVQTSGQINYNAGWVR